MGAYPPPPMPPAGGPMPPPYSPYDRRAMKAQQRAMRQQARWQARMQRRGSIVGPLLILALGIVFLLAQMGKLNWLDVFHWYSSWWPLVLIAAGALLLVEWAFARRNDDGTPRPRTVLGGGVIFLLILLGISGVAVSLIAKMDLARRSAGLDFTDVMSAMGERHDEDTTLANGMEGVQSLLVRVPRGDVTITGTSEDGQVHVNAHKEVHTWKDSVANQKLSDLQPVFNVQGGVLNLTVPGLVGGRADLTIQVPRATAITVNADHGEINISQIHAAVSVSAGEGEVNLEGLVGPVSAHMGGSHTSFIAHSVTGEVNLEGRSSEVTVSEITGPVSLQGTFYGTVHLEHVNGPVGFHSNRTKFDAARLDGELNFEGGEDLEAEALMGPVTLQTAYKNIRLDRVQGDVHVINRDGGVTVTHTSPMSTIEITNKSGSVDLGLPEKAAFELQAETRHGDIETDFGISSNGNGENGNKAYGKVAGGGPLVKIITDNGDVTVRRAATQPLPPAAPTPPKVTVAPPEKDSIPAVPKVPKAPKVPAAPGKGSDWK